MAEIEAPFALREGHPPLAGHYIGLDARYITKDHFLGNPDKAYEGNLVVKPSSKTALLDCPCGVLGCWPLEADILIGEDHIIWEHFEQAHRRGDSPQIPWDYGDLSFKFDKKQYGEEVSKVGAEPNAASPIAKTSRSWLCRVADFCIHRRRQ